MFNPTPKFEYYRSEKHLNMIRSMACVGCGRPPRSQAAHSNSGVHGKGMKIKASHEFTIPLCVYCHAEFDRFEGDHSKREENEKWFMGKLKMTVQILDLTQGLLKDAKRLLIERGVL